MVTTSYSAFSASAHQSDLSAFTTDNFGISPAIAAGKGWRNFDIQLTFESTSPIDCSMCRLTRRLSCRLAFELL
jgi:hypothetical protein